MNKKIFFTLLSTIWTTIWKQLQTSFRYRRAGGDDYNKLPGNNCQAKIETIYGNTVKWNQLVKNEDYSQGTTNVVTFRGSVSVSSGVATYTYTTLNQSFGRRLTPNTIQGHKYFVKGLFNTPVAMTVRIISNYTVLKEFISSANVYKWYGGIVTAPANATLEFGCITVDGGTSFMSKGEIVIDLTLLGIDNFTTTAEVESWLSLNVGEQEYYPYDPGSLISFKGQGVKSVGFNQWDEEWELGGYDSYTGQKTIRSDRIRSTNKISVIPNTTYYGKSPNDCYVLCYDANGNFITGVSGTRNYFSIQNSTFISPVNCYYIVLEISTSYGITYNYDICINISDPAKNGIYKPYWEDVLPIDPIKVYGKVNGEGSYVQCFPDGMRSAGSVKDGLSKSEAVVRVGNVDLGTLYFSMSPSYANVVQTDDILSVVKPPQSGTKANILSKFNTKTSLVTGNDNLLSENSSNAVGTGGRYYIYDTSLTNNSIDGNGHIAALDGVILNYELATPITYTDLIYSEDGGVTGIPLSEFKYKVDKYSTEELIVPSDSTGAPTSTPIIADITYQYKGGGAEETLWYGVQWNTTNSSPTLERIGSTLRHHTLPVQNSMRRCLLSDIGEVTYLSNEDTDKLEDGTIADLTGESGQVMVEIPSYYIKFETDGDIRRVKISMYNLDGFQLVPKMYISAYEAAMDRTSNKLSSVVNKTTRYRGGNNTSSWDGTYRSLLGMPATNITTTNFRSYARARGNGWEMYAHEAHKSIYWLFCVEYATLNSQAAYNPNLDVSGYHLGGLGNGVTTISAWNDYNSYNPLVPCGVTNSLGNHTGIISYSVMASNGSILQTFRVPSYRGIENPFGHIWKMSDGSMMVSESSVPHFYVCPLENHSQWASSKNSYYTLRGTLPTSSGVYAKRHLFGVNGDMVPDLAGGTGTGSTTYMCDYFYITNSSTRTLFFGGAANSGAYAGLSYANAYNGFSSADAYCGSRLCYFPVS